MKIRLLLLALAATALSPSAPASTKLLAMPDMSCNAWKATRGDPELRAPYLQWVRGFLSGHNYANPSGQMSVVSEGTVEVFIDRYCAEKAAASVAEAAMRMSDRYSGRNAPISR